MKAAKAEHEEREKRVLEASEPPTLPPSKKARPAQPRGSVGAAAASAAAAIAAGDASGVLLRDPEDTGGSSSSNSGQLAIAAAATAATAVGEFLRDAPWRQQAKRVVLVPRPPATPPPSSAPPKVETEPEALEPQWTELMDLIRARAWDAAYWLAVSMNQAEVSVPSDEASRLPGHTALHLAAWHKDPAAPLWIDAFYDVICFKALYVTRFHLAPLSNHPCPTSGRAYINQGFPVGRHVSSTFVRVCRAPGFLNAAWPRAKIPGVRLSGLYVASSMQQPLDFVLGGSRNAKGFSPLSLSRGCYCFHRFSIGAIQVWATYEGPVGLGHADASWMHGASLGGKRWERRHGSQPLAGRGRSTLGSPTPPHRAATFRGPLNSSRFFGIA